MVSVINCIICHPRLALPARNAAACCINAGYLKTLAILDAGPREAVGGTGKRTPLPEIAEDDVYHGHAPLGAAAAHRGLARCLTQSGSAQLQGLSSC